MAISNNLTPMQNLKIQKAGLNSLYELITYFPYKLEFYSPLEQIFDINKNLNKQNEVKLQQNFYKVSPTLFTGTASVLRINSVKTGFSVIHFKISNSEDAFNYLDKNDFNYYENSNLQYFQAYYFGPSKIIFQSIKIGSIYHIRVQRNQKGFINLLNFKLATSANKQYPNLLPRYSRLNALDTKFFRSVFERLVNEDFFLDLTGLFPRNKLIPNIINLKNIHLPNSPKSFYKTLQEWQNFQSLLDLYFLNKINSKVNLQGVKSKFNLNNLENITKNIPYELSETQGKAVRKIIKELI